MRYTKNLHYLKFNNLVNLMLLYEIYGFIRKEVPKAPLFIHIIESSRSVLLLFGAPGRHTFPIDLCYGIKIHSAKKTPL